MLQVQSNLDPAIQYAITTPLTLEFDVDKKIMSKNQSGIFRIYNLAPEIRAAVFQDPFRIEGGDFRKIAFSAGYESQSQLNLCFAGGINSASSYRQGPNWITEIRAEDGVLGFMSGVVSFQRPAGWDAAEVIEALCGRMSYGQFGGVGNVVVNNSRELAAIGSPYELMRSLMGAGQMFYDNGILYGMNDNEYLDKPNALTLVYGPDNILGSPRRGGTVTHVETIFEPGAYLGQRVHLTSMEPIFNGFWQVRGLRHSGTISQGVCGSATTSFTLFRGSNTQLSPVRVVR